MVAAIAAAQIGADQLELLLVVDLEIDAVRGSAEMGVAAVDDDAGGRAASGRDPVDAARLRPAVGGQAAAAARLVDDGRPIRREARTAVMAGLLGDGAHPAA